ncbi:hypothetical protein MRF4_27310 [Methylobacterium radiotolerans]
MGSGSVLALVSQGYSEPEGTFPRVTHPSAADPEGPARLACVKPAASVRSEPGSNSHVEEIDLADHVYSQTEPHIDQASDASQRQTPVGELRKKNNRSAQVYSRQVLRPSRKDKRRPRLPSSFQLVKERPSHPRLIRRQTEDRPAIPPASPAACQKMAQRPVHFRGRRR